MGTVLEWLQELATAKQSSDIDSKKMQNLLHKMGFGNAVVIYGVVYLEGKGRPTSIHSVAKEILSAIEPPEKKHKPISKKRGK